MVFRYARIVFYSIFVVTVFISFSYKAIKRKPIPPQKQANKPCSMSVVSIIEHLTAIVALAVLLITIINYQHFAWFFLLISTPFFLRYIIGAYSSIGIVRSVIQSKETNRLSEKEHLAIMVLSYSLFYLDILKLPTMLMDYVAKLDNIFLSDCLYIILYVTLLFLYTFLSCSLLLTPLTLLSRILVKWNAFFIKKVNISRAVNYFLKEDSGAHADCSLIIKAFEATRHRQKVLRYLVVVAFPFLFALDLVLIIARILLGLLLTSIGYFFLLVRMIKHTIGKAVFWISTSSDRRLVATSFRVALIVTMTLTVVINRYSPLLRNYKTGTGILEFIAGVILIPVAFEWITSAKKTRH